MPATTRKSSPDLAIQVNSLGRPFKPGDVITGRVIRQSHAVSPMATVEICLFGRAKVKLGKTRSNGQSTYTTYYRGRFNFFGRNTRRQLFTGPIHIPQEGPGQSWDFAIEIPLHPLPAALLSEHSDPKSSFLSLASSAIASSSLPGSFSASGRSRSTTFESYVEYHLEASLIQQRSHGSSSTATMPLILQSSPFPHPLTSSNLKRHTQAGTVSTYRLIPGMENAHLSLKQKTQKLFHSSQVPGLHFVAQIDCPSVIQLDNPSPVPFRVSIVPGRRHTSAIIQDAPQTASITSLQLVLKADTYVIAPGTLATYESNDADKHRIVLPTFTPVVAERAAEKPASSNTVDDDSLPAYENTNCPEESDEKAKPPAYAKTDPANSSEEEAGPSSRVKVVPVTPDSQQEPLLLPIGWDQDNVQPLDIGTVLDLHIHRTYVTALGKRISGSLVCPIYPSFTTYCIKHLHRLKWKMEIMIAGESVKLEGESLVSVLGPSHS